LAAGWAGGRILLTVAVRPLFEIGRRHVSWVGYQVRDLLELVKAEGFQVSRIPSDGCMAGIDSGVVEKLVGLSDPSGFR
jgi:hypothetical protein